MVVRVVVENVGSMALDDMLGDLVVGVEGATFVVFKVVALILGCVFVVVVSVLDGVFIVFGLSMPVVCVAVDSISFDDVDGYSPVVGVGGAVCGVVEPAAVVEILSVVPDVVFSLESKVVFAAVVTIVSDVILALVEFSWRLVVGDFVVIVRFIVEFEAMSAFLVVTDIVVSILGF